MTYYSTYRDREYRRELVDSTVPGNGKTKAARIDLGLELLCLLSRPGMELTQHDIAVWCGCSVQAVQQIEQRCMKKIRNRFRFGQLASTGKELTS